MHFIPFRAIRPTRDKASLVGSRSYLEYSDEELDDKLKNNPYTFLHIINPDFQQQRHLHGRTKFEAVKKEFQKFVGEGIFVKEERPAYYLYRQTHGELRFTGLIGGTAVEDYRQGHIKVHENTLTAREEMFKEYLEITGFNAEPVLLTYPNIKEVDTLVEELVTERPEYEFSTTDRVKHEFWVVSHPGYLETFKRAFLQLPQVYIADGHHRCASSMRLADSLYKGSHKDPHQTFMSLLIPESQLRILPFHRMVKDLGQLAPADLLAALDKNFEVEHRSEAVEVPEGPFGFGLYVANNWYHLRLRQAPASNSPVARLDCQVLSDAILDPLLHITDLKTDPRIKFIPGNEPIGKLVGAVDREHYKALFTLAPISTTELKAVSDANEVMPPKSTYVEPKLRSGLTVYDLYNW